MVVKRSSGYKEDVFEKAYNIYNSVNGTPYKEHITNVRNAFRFYDGHQWYDEEISKLKARGQGYTTVNIIAPKIDNLVGLEIQSQSSMSVGSNFNNPENNFLAASLSHLIYNIQEVNSFNRVYSLILKDMAICGIGFPYVYKENGVYKIGRSSPFTMGPDLSDSDNQFANMRYIWKKLWLDPIVVKKHWKKTAANIEIPDQNSAPTSLSPEFMDRQTNYTDFSMLNGRMLVVEVQYKVPTIGYTGFDRNDRYFKTFDYNVAEDISASKNEINEETFDRVKRTLITVNDTVLEHSNLDPDLPIDLKQSNYTGFTHFTSVWKKEELTGLPYGVVKPSMDICRVLNHRLQRWVYLSDSRKLFIKGKNKGGLLGFQTIEQVREELRRDDAVLAIDGDYEYRENIDLGDKSLTLIREAYNMVDMVSGIYGDQTGQETNATSGVALNYRQVSSVRNNVTAYDTLLESKKSLLTFLLHMILGSYDRNILCQAADEKQKESILLNISHMTKNGEIIYNNIDNFPGFIYVKEGPNYRSSFEENQAKIEAFLQNPNASLYVHSTKLMEQIGITDGKEISQDLLQAIRLKAMAEQGVLPPEANQQGLPPPNQGEMAQMSPQQLLQGGMQ